MMLAARGGVTTVLHPRMLNETSSTLLAALLM